MHDREHARRILLILLARGRRNALDPQPQDALQQRPASGRFLLDPSSHDTGDGPSPEPTGPQGR